MNEMENGIRERLSLDIRLLKRKNSMKRKKSLMKYWKRMMRIITPLSA